MIRSIRGLASLPSLVALLASGCATPSAPPPDDPAVAARLVTACALVPHIDRARIPASPDWSWVGPLFERARGTAPDPVGDSVLRVAIQGAGRAAPVWNVAAVAARRPDGRWFVSYGRDLAVAPPPPPPGSPPAAPIPPSGVYREGLLTIEAGRTIDAALASDCLRSQPAVQPATLPMRGSEDRPCPPDAGGLHALEIVKPGPIRRFTHACGRDFASGLIIATIDNWGSLEGAN